MRWFLVKFCILSIVIFTFHFQEAVYASVTQPWTELLAKISAWIVQVFDSQVTANGVYIYTTRVNDQGFSGVEIAAGCNGIEAWLVLVAAIVSFPSPWLYKLKGLIIGFIAIQAVNIIRVISLFYLGQWSKEVFDFAHYYAWQVLIILDAFVVFLIWLARLPGSDSDSGTGSTDNNKEEQAELAKTLTTESI